MQRQVPRGPPDQKDLHSLAARRTNNENEPWACDSITSYRESDSNNNHDIYYAPYFMPGTVQSTMSSHSSLKITQQDKYYHLCLKLEETETQRS